jgi:hypothetical protein
MSDLRVTCPDARGGGPIHGRYAPVLWEQPPSIGCVTAPLPMGWVGTCKAVWNDRWMACTTKRIVDRRWPRLA